MGSRQEGGKLTVALVASVEGELRRVAGRIARGHGLCDADDLLHRALEWAYERVSAFGARAGKSFVAFV